MLIKFKLSTACQSFVGYGLLGVTQNEGFKNKEVDISSHNARIGVFWSAYNWLPPNIEACVQHKAKSGCRRGAVDNGPEFGFVITVYGLDFRGVVHVVNRGEIWARMIDALDKVYAIIFFEGRKAQGFAQWGEKEYKFGWLLAEKPLKGMWPAMVLTNKFYFLWRIESLP